MNLYDLSGLEMSIGQRRDTANTQITGTTLIFLLTRLALGRIANSQ